MISVFDEKLERSVLDLAPECEVDENAVARAAEFTVLANEKWRQYSLMYAMNSTMQHLHQPTPPVTAY